MGRINPGPARDAGPSGKAVSDIEAENSRLRRELAEVQAGARPAKKGVSVLCQGTTAKYAFMKSCCRGFPVLLMCRVFEGSRSGYQAWPKRKPSVRAVGNGRLAVAIRAAHERSRETCGPLRLGPELAAAGHRAGLGRIRRIRNDLGLRCRQSRRFKASPKARLPVPRRFCSAGIRLNSES